MAEYQVITTPQQGNYQYRLLVSCRKGETVNLNYTGTLTAGGNVEVPTSVTLTLATEREGTATYTATATPTGSGTSYSVALTIPAATTATLEGKYFLSIKEVRTIAGTSKIEGDLYVSDCVEATP